MDVQNQILFLISLYFITSSLADNFASKWGADTRRWVGPDWWANPLQDWSLSNGEALVYGGADRALCLTSYTIVSTSRMQLFQMSVELSFSKAPSTFLSAGFRIGRKGRNPHWMNSLIDSTEFIDATVSANGHLNLADQRKSTKYSSKPNIRIRLTLNAYATTTSNTATVELFTTFGSIQRDVKKTDLLGGVSLITVGADMGYHKNSTFVRFSSFSIDGDGILDVSKARRLGPIMWTQYTLSHNVLRLQAQLMPIEQTGKSVTAALLVLRSAKGNAKNGKWVPISQANMHLLARTTTFIIPNWNSSQSTQYVVRLRWNNEVFKHWGTVRSEPKNRRLKLAVFSCDDGYAFPLRSMVRQVQRKDPDMVLFLGDQIYESYGGYDALRFGPLEDSMLDYLRKFYQFGLTWRDLLRDRPSVIIPDDHDVFQGNLFGHGGRELPIPTPSGMTNRKLQENMTLIENETFNSTSSKNDGYDWMQGRTSVPYSYIEYGRGGYVLPGGWVSAVEQTQVGHLPIPATPKTRLPIGIGTYFTRMEYSAVSFAILEDRKFKTGYLSYANNDNRKWSGEGASLLGKSQEDFLESWATDWSGHCMKVALSQTMFAKAFTHSGPKLRRSKYFFDSGAWPFNARNRAVQILAKAKALTLHGDQHLGVLAELDDGKGHSIQSLMVPGTANGWPRAWWPNGRNGKVTGLFRDDMNHRIRVLAVGNPDSGSTVLANLLGNKITSAELAYRKGSGYGFVILDKKEKTAKIELFRVGRESIELFDGFPKTIEIGGKNNSF